MALPGIPAGGLKTVGQIIGTNDSRFHPSQDALSIALELLTSHISGAPVIEASGRFVGFVSEFDVLRALREGRDLRRVRASEIMSKEPCAVNASTLIEEAAQIMEKNRWLTLPVEKDGVVQYSITRHDLLRAWIGLGVGIEE